MKLTTSRKLFIAAGLITIAGGAIAEWPEKPISLIVPWGAGGATDQVTRVVAAELEDALGQKVVVLNQEGASGSIGSKAALDAPNDGYTWTAGAAKDLGTYAVTGKLDTSIKDWDLYLNSALASVVSVGADSSINDMAGFIEALQDGKLTVGTSGVNSAGHSAIESIVAQAGGSYRHVAYDGGAEAVLSTVSGETIATTQLISEQMDMLRAGQLKPLAILSGEAVDIEGVGTVPPITDALPDLKPSPIYFGVFVPGDVPEEVTAKLESVWMQTIANSDALREYTEGRGSIMTVHAGQDAQDRVWPSIQSNAWLLHDGGQSAVSPEDLGIPRP